MGIGILESISIGINPNLFSAGGFTSPGTAFSPSSPSLRRCSWWCAGPAGRGWTSIASIRLRCGPSSEGLSGPGRCTSSTSGARSTNMTSAGYSRSGAGGIAIFGAISGGFVGGSLYLLIRNSALFMAIWRPFRPSLASRTRQTCPESATWPTVTAPALLVAMAIGRIGDIINGEHFASATNLPWGVIYTHPDSPGLGRPPTHPAVAYELLFDIALLAVLCRCGTACGLAGCSSPFTGAPTPSGGSS